MIYSEQVGFDVSVRCDDMERREREFRFRNVHALQDWHHQHDMSDVSVLTEDLGRMLHPTDVFPRARSEDGESDESSQSDGTSPSDGSSDESQDDGGG